VPDVFLTGGSGYVGGDVLARLAADGRPVRALVRDERGRAKVLGRGAREAVEADLLGVPSLRAAMEGCRVVYHVAGVNTLCPHDRETMYRINVEGSVNVVQAAADTGIERVVYTSSAAVIGEGRGVIADETTPHRGSFHTVYERSKHDAEAAVLAAAERLGVDLVCVNPSSVQGPGRTGGTARLLIAYLSGRLRLAVDVPMSLVYGPDCAAAHVLAEERGSPGERYLVSGVTLTVSEALRTLGEVTGETHRVRMLPGWLVRAAAAPVGWVYRLLGRDAPLCSEAARAMLHGHRYDGSKAESDLGLRYTPVGEWLEATVAWYREQGLV
jgi:dihydroflavonol-4-reductase